MSVCVCALTSTGEMLETCFINIDVPNRCVCVCVCVCTDQPGEMLEPCVINIDVPNW